MSNSLNRLKKKFHNQIKKVKYTTKTIRVFVNKAIFTLQASQFSKVGNKLSCNKFTCIIHILKSQKMKNRNVLKHGNDKNESSAYTPAHKSSQQEMPSFTL